MFDFFTGDTAERRFRGLIVLGILIYAVSFRLLVDNLRVADFDTYVTLLSRDIIGRTDTGVFGEPLGWLSIRVGYSYTLNTYKAVLIASYAVTAYFLFGVHVLARRYDVPWQGLLIAFAVFGPLLAFVLIRASPAYLLVTMAALDAAKGRWRALLICFAAILFHVSALLSIAPIVVTLAVARLPKLSAFFARQALAAVLVLLVVVPFVLFRQALLDVLQQTLLSSGGPLGRLGAYFVSADTAARGVQTSSIYHFLYFILCSLLVTGYLLFVTGACNGPIRAYVMLSFGTFVLLEGAPIAAFRQSIYWLVPILMTFPWPRVVGGVIRPALLIAACLFLLLGSTLGVVLQ